VGILFGLGNAQLGFAVFGQVIAQYVFQTAGSKCAGCRDAGGVLGQHHETCQLWLTGAGEGVEIIFNEHPGQFTGAVGTEVHEDYGVAVFNTYGFANGGGLDEFVAFATCVGSFQTFLGGSGVELALAVDDQVVGLLDTVPAIITVHCEVTTDQAGDTALAQVLEGFVQQFNGRCGAFGRGIATIEEGVQVDLFCAALVSQLGHCDQVILMAVNTAIRQQTQDVHGLACTHCLVDSGADGRVLKELAITDRLGDAGEILIHHAAGTQVHVADLGVAHLAVRQTDIHARTRDQAVRHARAKTIQHRFLGRINGVVFVTFTVTEAIQDDQDQRFRRGSHRSHSWLVYKKV